MVMEMEEQIINSCFSLVKHYFSFLKEYMMVNTEVAILIQAGFEELFKRCKKDSTDPSIALLCYSDFKLEIKMMDVFIGKNDKYKYD